MKNTILLGILAGAFSFSACNKETSSLSAVNEPIKIRYEFSADHAADYRFFYKVDTLNIEETVVTDNWVKSFTVPREEKPRVAKMVVYRPASWAGTTLQANVHLKLYINDVQKKDTSYLMTDIDRSDGISVTTTY